MRAGAVILDSHHGGEPGGSDDPQELRKRAAFPGGLGDRWGMANERWFERIRIAKSIFTRLLRLCKARIGMPGFKKFFLLLILPVLMAGCTAPSIVNLTPGRLPRKDNGLYSFEALWESRQQSLVKESMKAYVVVGFDQYEMQRVPMLTNRWETLVPISADKNVVNYHFKFDYEYRAIPQHRSDSKTSKPYQLLILNQN